MSSRPELVPLADRVGALQLARLGLGVFVVAVVSFAQGAVGTPSLGLVELSVAYVLVTGAFETLRRLSNRRGLELISTLLLVDGCYLVVVVAATGGLASPLLFLVHLHVAATALLVSFRSGVAVSIWHFLLLITVDHVSWASGPGTTAAVDLVLAGASYLVVGVATSAFASLNERALRDSRLAATTLLELGVALEECRSLDDVTSVGARHLQRWADQGRATVLVRDDTGWSGALADGRAVAPVRLRVARPPTLGDGIRRPSLHAALDPEVWPELDAVLPGAGNVVVVPLVADGRDVGLAALETSQNRPTFPVDELETVDQSVARIALSVRAVQLLDEVERLATSDPLTGLPNRRVFDEALAREVGRARRYGTSLALAILDVDHFKRVNDVHGHPIGDEVLRQLATALRSATRPESLVARYGGEEFVVLLPDADSEDAVTAAERLRVAAAEVEAVRITVSIGVALLGGEDDADALVRAADTALYEAKEAGRDRTVCRTFRPPLEAGRG